MVPRKSLTIIAIIFCAALVGCGQSNQISGSGLGPKISGLTNGPVLPIISGQNVLPLTVNGSQCSPANSQGYFNKPCVSVTICSTTNSNCQTINDVLVDTGSYGLRIFKSVLNSNLNLSMMTVASQSIGDCQQYGVGPGGTADWGPVALANVVLGGEPAVTVPVELIEPTFGNSSVCSAGGFTLDTDPVQTGYNAILGVGLFQQDCGPACASSSNNGQYFACSGASCSGIAVPLANQVSNPVFSLPQDNNGVVLELPSVPLGGVPSANGYLVIGIGTQPNNSPSQVTDYAATIPVDEFGEFKTVFGGINAVGFVDSGTNSLLFFKIPSLPDCTNSSGYYCPGNLLSFSAENIATTASTTVPFQIGDEATFNASNSVFVELGADDDPTDNPQEYDFDWGLPFFLGRNVFVGYDGQSTPLGTGPYWAF